MSKTYKFSFSDEPCFEEDSIPYPIASSIEANHEFTTGSTWDVILWQFCKFLESTGYNGVTDNIRIVDNYGIRSQNMLFECIREDETNKDNLTDDECDEEVDWNNLKEYTISLDSTDKDAQ